MRIAEITGDLVDSELAIGVARYSRYPVAVSPSPAWRDEQTPGGW
jgi:hypothetical protein